MLSKNVSNEKLRTEYLFNINNNHKNKEIDYTYVKQLGSGDIIETIIHNFA